MADSAERDVIISLKLAADPKNKATAAEVAGQAQSVIAASSDAYSRMEKFAEQAMASATKIQAAQADLRVDIEAQSNAERVTIVEDTLNRLVFLEEQQTRAQVEELEKRQKAREDDSKKQEKEAEELSEKIRDAEEKRSEGHQKANESAVAAIQGLADMAEGAAKLGLVSEDNFEKFARNFIIVQEGIRVFKGMTDVIWKTREGLIALGKAKQADIAINNLQAASNLRVAGTTAAAAGTGVAAGVGRGAVQAGASTATQVGTGVVAGGAMTMGMKVVAGFVAVAAKLAAVAAVLAEAFQLVARGFEWLIGANWDWNDSILATLLSYREASNEAEKNEKETEAREKKRRQRQESLERFEQEQAARAKLQGDLLSGRRGVEDARALVNGSDSSPTASAERERLQAMEDIRIAEAAILEDRKLQEERIAKTQYASDANRERVMRGLEEAQNRLLEAEKTRLTLIRDQKQQINEQIKAEREKLQIARDAMKSEKQRLLEGYGRLTAEQRYRVEQVSEKKRRGEDLTQQDVADLESAGMAGMIAGQFYANQGAQAGGLDVINNLGLLDQQQADIDKARRAESERRAELATLTSQEDQAEAAVMTAAERRQRIINERVGINARQQNVSDEDINGFNANQPSQVDEIQQAAADASDNITARSMEVVEAFGTVLDAVTEGFEDLADELKKRDIIKKAYDK